MARSLCFKALLWPRPPQAGGGIWEVPHDEGCRRGESSEHLVTLAFFAHGDPLPRDLR